jgi:hypothetical protein
VGSQAVREDAIELHENRTELERLLADVWNYEDGGARKTGLPKWIFAVTLAGALLYTFSPSDVVAPVTTTFAPGAEKTPVDRVSSENLDEDLDYRIAGQTKSPAGWRAFLEAHPNGPHAQAARAEIDRLPTTSPEPVESAEQSPPSAPAAQSPAASIIAENEPAQPQPVEVAEQPLPVLAATQTPIEAAQPRAPSPTAKNEPAPPPRSVVAAGEFVPSPTATETPAEATQSPAPAAPTVMAENESASPSIPAVATDAIPPLPPLRPREVAVAKSDEPAHHGHSHAKHGQASRPNVLTILIAQLLHSHRQRADIGGNGGRL